VDLAVAGQGGEHVEVRARQGRQAEHGDPLGDLGRHIDEEIVAAKLAVVTEEDARRILARMRTATTQPRDESPRDAVLTPRETELLRLTAKGLSFDAIGQLLEISPHTVVAHVKKIYRKLAVHSRGEAVYEANQMGLL